jgi:biotin transport system substrate-specific component
MSHPAHADGAASAPLTADAPPQATASASTAARARWGARDLALVAVFTALVAVLAAMPAIPVGGAGVPITLQTLGVGLCGMVLGPARGFLSLALYLALGLIGLPIFSNFSGGLGVLAGPSVGYLIAFPLYALLVGVVAGWLVRRYRGWKLWALLLVGGVITSFITVHPLGIAGMAVNLGLTTPQAIVADMPFWPGDIIKNAGAAALAVVVHRAFPGVLVRR